MSGQMFMLLAAAAVRYGVPPPRCPKRPAHHAARVRTWQAEEARSGAGGDRLTDPGRDECEMRGFMLVAADDVRYGVKMRREFGSHLENITPECDLVKLIARDGLVFDVEVIKDFYEPFLSSDGWEEFVDATNIQEGDSIMFVHRGNFCFKAHIFNSSGHDKYLFCCQHLSGTLCDHHVMNGHVAQEVNDQPSMNLEEGCVPMDLPSGNPKRKKSPVVMTPDQQCLQISAVQQIGVEQCGIEVGSNNLMGPSQRPYILPENTTLPSPLERKVKEKVKTIQSELPIFVRELPAMSVDRTSREVCALTFCREFFSACLPYWKTDIYLHVEGKTKSWRTKFNVRRDGVSWIYSVWREFVGENDLKVGDVCLFQAKEKGGRTLIVHVIRSEIEL